jgi:hypothetical protein
LLVLYASLINLPLIARIIFYFFYLWIRDINLKSAESVIIF